jgi:uncharacterized protein (DUF433 family)
MFDRIASDPAILSGKPIIRGTRISVTMILEWISAGASRDDILRKHPHLTTEDIVQALAHAAECEPGPAFLVNEVMADDPLLEGYQKHRTDEAEVAKVLRIAWMRRVGLDEEDIVESLRDEPPVGIDEEMTQWRAIDRLDQRPLNSEILRAMAIKYY